MKFGLKAGTVILLASLSCLPLSAQNQQVIKGSRPLRKVLEAYQEGKAPFTRIVGGHDTTIGAHPWQVALVAASVPANSSAQFCGGTVVAKHWVLTAAHCVDGDTTSDQIKVLINTASLQAGGQRVQVVQGGIVINDDWNQTTYDSDIALIHLAEDINSTPIPGPVLAAQEHDGDKVVVTGWGAINSKQDPPRTNILQEVTVEIIGKDPCNKKASYDNQVNNHMLCLGDFDHGQKDSCTGDSGGPATITVNSEARLIGIVSWSDPQAKCGTPKKPGVYTRISQYVPWVREKSGEEISW